MIDLEHPYRPATPDDAAEMAELINFAGEGMPHYLWAKMAEPGETVWDVGRRRARRQEGSFSYRNAVIVEHQGRAVSCLVGYGLADDVEPIDYDEMPAMFVPLQELENMAPGTWYVNVLATYPEHRKQGHGSGLLKLAERIAAKAGKPGLSIIVSDANDAARRLYEGLGYSEIAKRPMVKDDWENDGENWLLLTKSL